MRLLLLFTVLVACGVPGVPIVEDVVLACTGILWRYDYFGPSVLPVAFAGIVLGDLVTYWFGRRYGGKVMDRIPEALDRKISLWYERYGSLTVLFLRVGPGLRLSGFLLAGATRMPLRKFITMDTVGALVSMPLFVGLGWISAGAFDRAERALWIVGISATVVLISAGAFVYVKFKKEIA